MREWSGAWISERVSFARGGLKVFTGQNVLYEVSIDTLMSEANVSHLHTIPRGKIGWAVVIHVGMTESKARMGLGGLGAYLVPRGDAYIDSRADGHCAGVISRRGL